MFEIRTQDGSLVAEVPGDFLTALRIRHQLTLEAKKHSGYYRLHYPPSYGVRCTDGVIRTAAQMGLPLAEEVQP